MVELKLRETFKSLGYYSQKWEGKKFQIDGVEGGKGVLVSFEGGPRQVHVRQEEIYENLDEYRRAKEYK